MSVQTWMLFAAAYLATTLSPGPNVLLVIRNTVRYGAHGTGATIACTVVVVHSVYSAGVRRLHRGFGMSRAVRALKRASGLLFVGLGVKLLTARQA